MNAGKGEKKRPFTIGPPRFRLLPDDTYRARLLRIEEGDGRFGKVFIPWFEIIGGPYSGSEVKDMISQERAEARNSKFCHMIYALKPHFKLEEMAKIDLEELESLECYIKTERRKEKNIAITQYFPLTDFEEFK